MNAGESIDVLPTTLLLERQMMSYLQHHTASWYGGHITRLVGVSFSVNVLPESVCLSLVPGIIKPINRYQSVTIQLPS